MLLSRKVSIFIQKHFSNLYKNLCVCVCEINICHFLGLNDQESSRRRRLPFSIGLNQMVTGEIQVVYGNDF